MCKTQKRPTSGIVLGAGSSRRFGSMKQLAKLENRHLITIVLDSAIQSNLDHVCLVLGHQSEMLNEVLEDYRSHEKLTIIINPRHQEGMSTSLQTGVEAIKKNSLSCMILLADQPLIDTVIINTVLNRFYTTDRSICTASFGGMKGHPVCLDSRYFEHIFNISGDKGARDIIRNNPNDIECVELESDMFWEDIDRPIDLQRIQSIYKPSNKHRNQ